MCTDSCMDFGRKYLMAEEVRGKRVLVLKKDPQYPGVFVKAHKPVKLRKRDLRSMKLYTFVTNKKVACVKPHEIRNFQRLLKALSGGAVP